MLLIDVEGDGDLDLVATAATTIRGRRRHRQLVVRQHRRQPRDPLGQPVRGRRAAEREHGRRHGRRQRDCGGRHRWRRRPDDLVFSTWSRMSGGVAVQATNRYYINNSTPGSINFETTGTFGTADNHTNVRLADFDNDTDLDLITLVFDGRERAAPQRRCARPTSTQASSSWIRLACRSAGSSPLARCRLRRSQRRRLARPGDRESRPARLALSQQRSMRAGQLRSRDTMDRSTTSVPRSCRKIPARS